jgi:hypothetical protein
MSDAEKLLEAHDAFLSGHPLTEGQSERARSVAQAACFAAAAYNAGGEGGQNIAALARAFLLALIDPMHSDLDYLRADPASGRVARDVSVKLQAMTTTSPKEAGE